MKPFTSFVRHVSFPLLSRQDGLHGIMRYLKELNKSQYMSAGAIRKIQFKRLKRLLMHANTNVAYYRTIFQETGFDPDTFKSFDDLKSLPILTKSIIRHEKNKLLADNIPENKIHRSETGGTTGVKMQFYRDNACLAPKEAALYRFEQWAGWDIGERSGIVWPAQQDYVGYWTLKSKIKNELYRRQIVLPAAVLDEDEIDFYVKKLRIKKPTLIRAFATPIYEVARFIKNYNINDITLNGIISTGEPLYDHQRESISQAFHCPVYDSYRCREVGPVAQECEEHNGMHINSESLYVEVIPPDDPDNFEKGIGEIIITDLLNYGMPFIRYKMGDMGSLINESCRCGRELPRLRRLSGRTADLFITPDGKKLASSSLVLYLVDEAPGEIGQIQIIQDRHNHLIIRYTPDPPISSATMEYQKKMVHHLFGESMLVSFEKVKEIKKEASGKYVFTKCLLDQAV